MVEIDRTFSLNSWETGQRTVLPSIFSVDSVDNQPLFPVTFHRIFNSSFWLIQAI